MRGSVTSYEDFLSGFVQLQQKLEIVDRIYLQVLNTELNEKLVLGDASFRAEDGQTDTTFWLRMRLEVLG
jgi:hypothetical protein